MAVSLFGLFSLFGLVGYNQRIVASGIKVRGSRFFAWPLLLSGFLDNERWWERTAGHPNRDALKQKKTTLEQDLGGRTWDAYKEISEPGMTPLPPALLPTCPVHVRPFWQGSAMKKQCHWFWTVASPGSGPRSTAAQRVSLDHILRPEGQYLVVCI